MHRKRTKTRLSEADKTGTLGFELFFWRQRRNMTQVDLARMLGISSRTLQSYEAASANLVPYYVHWALKGLELQTRFIRHVMLFKDFSTEIVAQPGQHTDAEEPFYKTPEGDIWLWLQTTAAPIFVAQPAGIPMPEPGSGQLAALAGRTRKAGQA